MALLDDGGDYHPGGEENHKSYDPEYHFHYPALLTDLSALHSHDIGLMFRADYTCVNFMLHPGYNEVTQAGRASDQARLRPGWFGGAGGIRTPYLLTASQTFSQVNYGPV